jgi:flagellar biosynthetic protein FliO
MTYQPEFIATAVKMFSALLLVMGIFFGSFYLLRRVVRRGGAGPGRELIKIIDRSYLEPKKKILLVEVSGEFLVLGITNDRISLLTKIEDKDGVQQLSKKGPMGASVSFSSHLSRLMAKLRESGPEKEASSVPNIP